MTTTIDYSAKLSQSASSNVKKWLSEPKYSEYRHLIISMIESQKWGELEDAFFKEIEFGTGGRRGTTGVGSNRINKVTIGESAQALCEYAKKHDPSASERGVVIAYDTRLSSVELSNYVATVCAGNGFKTFIYEGYRSTPQLSFTVREINAAIGIVISASHNPPEDNGFKAYWADGAQLVAPHDQGVLDVAELITEINNVQSYDDAVKSGDIVILGAELDEKYINTVCAEAVSNYRELSIVYSPLHGAGQRNTLPVLRKAGFTNILTVDEQMTPDGNFPTIENGKPNPEEKAANDHAVAKLLADEADIAITNDPDADRIGVMVRQNKSVVYLNGNQSAVLATEYVLAKMKQAGELTPSHYIAKTIVTTDMLKAVADNFNVKTYESLPVGFKYVGELIHKNETTGETFIIGGEESYGLLKGDYARDKDGSVGALLLAEYAAELKQKNQTLWDRMEELYDEYGAYVEKLHTLQCPGAEGFSQMQKIMSSLRTIPPLHIGSHKVTAVIDYKSLTRLDIDSGSKTHFKGVAGNVLVYEFGDSRNRITIRPSGTEPKMKFYVQWFNRVGSREFEQLVNQLDSLALTLEGIALERG